MSIRDFTPEDYPAVIALLIAGDVDRPVEIDELSGLCLVAEDKDEVVGVMYALCGESSKAYVDYLAVREDYRGTLVYSRLMQAMDARLKARGVKRYTFHVERGNNIVLDHLLKYRKKQNITMLRSLHYFSREIQ